MAPVSKRRCLMALPRWPLGRFARYNDFAPAGRRHSSTTNRPTDGRRWSDFNSGFSSSYDPNTEGGRGPMFHRPTFGVPLFYPRDLKKRVDEYVVGQERAKKVICSVIFNHYQATARRRTDEDREKRRRERAQRQKLIRDRDSFDDDRRRAALSYPSGDELPGHDEMAEPADDRQTIFDDETPFKSEDSNVVKSVEIDKSNLLLIGPTGVGKTFILETLSKKLQVPFTICDANSMTQAGYIGADPESCIERLLVEANYDTKAAERGIVVIDEIDKIARRETMNGRDVSGEGVQQALLKLVEGFKVTVNVKDNKSSRAANLIMNPTQVMPPSARSEQYTVDTRHILFVFCGAFVGLEKLVLKRVSKTSIGFGADIGNGRSVSAADNKLAPEVYAHLPHQPVNGEATTNGPLDLATPDDLQAFGFIPELIGRLHNICALSALTQDELFRILTEPRNSLVAQYTALFETYPSRLFFTRKALSAIAERALRSKTGARGLKMEMERILAEPMFDAPVPYVLVTEACVRGTEKAGYWGKDGRLEVERLVREEDEREEADRGSASTFEQYREAHVVGA